MSPEGTRGVRARCSTVLSATPRQSATKVRSSASPASDQHRPDSCSPFLIVARPSPLEPTGAAAGAVALAPTPSRTHTYTPPMSPSATMALGLSVRIFFCHDRRLRTQIVEAAVPSTHSLVPSSPANCSPPLSRDRLRRRCNQHSDAEGRLHALRLRCLRAPPWSGGCAADHDELAAAPGLARELQGDTTWDRLRLGP